MQASIVVLFALVWPSSQTTSKDREPPDVRVGRKLFDPKVITVQDKAAAFMETLQEDFEEILPNPIVLPSVDSTTENNGYMCGTDGKLWPIVVWLRSEKPTVLEVKENERIIVSTRFQLQSPHAKYKVYGEKLQAPMGFANVGLTFQKCTVEMTFDMPYFPAGKPWSETCMFNITDFSVVELEEPRCQVEENINLKKFLQDKVTNYVLNNPVKTRELLREGIVKSWNLKLRRWSGTFCKTSEFEAMANSYKKSHSGQYFSVCGHYQ